MPHLVDSPNKNSPRYVPIKFERISILEFRVANAQVG